MEVMQAVDGSNEVTALPVGLEGAVQSGRLAAEIVDRRAVNGAGDLLLSLVEVSRERFFTPPERLREVGRRSGARLCARLQHRLHQEWGVDAIAALPWPLFKTLASQLSDGLGLGVLDLSTDENSGLIRVRAWHWPFPESFEEGGYLYVLLEGFVTSLLEAVSPCPLEAVEATDRKANDVCELVVGSQAAVRLYLESAGRGHEISNGRLPE